MANIVENSLHIDGNEKTLEELAAFMATENSSFDFNSIVPLIEDNNFERGNLWGTKSNALNADWVDEDHITFQTLWNGVPDLILELSKKFPDLSFTYIFADEDKGTNTGEYVIENGEFKVKINPENYSERAIEIYNNLFGDWDEE